MLRYVLRNMHNAGNAVWCMYLALGEMAGGDLLDVQRTARWPQHTSTDSGHGLE